MSIYSCLLESLPRIISANQTYKLKRFRFFPGVFSAFLRNDSEKVRKTPKKTETFPEKKQNLLSFQVGQRFSVRCISHQTWLTNLTTLHEKWKTVTRTSECHICFNFFFSFIFFYRKLVFLFVCLFVFCCCFFVGNLRGENL